MNSRTYSEVYQIIQYLPESEYKLIPKWQIDFLKRNMDPTVQKNYTINTNIDDVTLTLETKTVLLTLFYMNIATDEQKSKIEQILLDGDKHQNEILYEKMFKQNIKLENYKQKYNSENTNKRSLEPTETSLTRINEEKWSYKIMNFFNNILKKFKLR